MKNMKKLAAGFIAAAMAMSMGVSAFAEVVAPAAVKNADDAVTGITFVVDGVDISKSSEEQITLLAYLIPETDANGEAYTAETIPAYSNQTIVALDQTLGTTGFGEIPVDTAKLEEGYAIAVKLGGSDGTVAQGLIVYNDEEEVPTIVVTFMNGKDSFATAEVGEDGKVTLPETNPTLAAVEGYATTAYTFVEWVTEDGTAFTTDNTVTANTTVYPKFKSNYVMGDVDGKNGVNGTDRLKIHNYIKNSKNQDSVNIPVTHLDPTIKTGDIDGKNGVNGTDRLKIHNYIKNSKNTDTVGIPIYVVNK